MRNRKDVDKDTMERKERKKCKDTRARKEKIWGKKKGKTTLLKKNQFELL